MPSKDDVDGGRTLPLEDPEGDVDGGRTLPLEDPEHAVEGGGTLPPEDPEHAVEGGGTLPPEDPEHAVESGRTLPPEDPPSGAPPRAAPARSASGIPAQWDRYELGDLLGKGGMGVVYRARDRRLGRMLAIKFLLTADPSLKIRFLREARAQARIDHPNVCRVYEVGEVEGRAYIALQLVAGEPLRTAAKQMSLEDKVAVMRDIAAAMQEAHQLSIVHRDLKPDNILVERSDDGRWIPVVMDFGLAREATIEHGLTESGAVLGTPSYMSPEQARGDVRAVDRRSDVYSLGATLYELLIGRPPFSRVSLAEALAEVIHDDPPAPRTVMPSLPIDLETIVLKCMTKDPAQRYPSARDLADDLGRYLAGEPILGRRLSLRQRLRRRARRHRALVVLGAWSLVIIVVVGALGVRTCIASRRDHALSAERTELAERLGREATEIEGALREAYLWPLHDTRPDRKRIRERMAQIAATPHEPDERSDAIVHEALGRGHLSLHEWSEANDELARAERSGATAPGLHMARARALDELYRRAVEEVRPIRSTPAGRSDDKLKDPPPMRPTAYDKEWQEHQGQELVRRYLTPALDELDHSRKAGESPALLEAMRALYSAHYAEAEQQARQVAERSPGEYEARKLVADAAYLAAIEVFDRGEYDAARAGLERAAQLYADASEIARSDASLYEGEGEAWLQRAEVDYRQGRPLGDALDHALALLDRAQRADPDDATPYTIRAEVLLRWYRTPALTGFGDQRATLAKIAETAGRAVQLDPRSTRAWNALGNAHLARGTYEQYHNGRSAAWLMRARDDFDSALAIAPHDPQSSIGQGAAHRWLGDYLDQVGLDPLPEYQAALDSYRRASASDPQFLKAWSYQADLYTTIAEHDLAAGRDPRSAVEDARRAGERCLTIDPHYYSVLNTLAQAQVALAHHVVDTGGDPSEPLARARGYVDRAEAVQPNHLSTWFFRLACTGAEAKFELKHGADPTSAIAAGQAALGRALGLKPDSSDAYVEAARLALVEAAWASHRGDPVAPHLARARAHAEKAVALDRQFADARLVAAEVCLAIATAQRSREAVEQGLAHVDQALALNPQLRKAHDLRAALERLRPP